MSKSPSSSSPSSSGDDRNLVSVDENYVALTFEDRLRIFWEKNSRAVLAACALVLAVILGKGAWEIVSAQREKSIAADYGAAGNDAAKLKAFVASHPEHVLAGIAQLRMADTAYSAANYAEARSAYEKAASILTTSAFGQRARLGAAISAVQGGAVAEGEAALKQIVSNLGLDKQTRAEAAYQLALLAASAGNSAEAIRLIEQCTTIDPDGLWADRASSLRATIPATAEPAGQPSATNPETKETTPSVSFK